MQHTRKARIGLCPACICYERNNPQGFRCLLHRLGLRGPVRHRSFWKAKVSGRKGRTQGFYWNEKWAIGCGLVILTPDLPQSLREIFWSTNVGLSLQRFWFIWPELGPKHWLFPRFLEWWWDWEPLQSKVLVSERAGLEIPNPGTYTYFLWIPLMLAYMLSHFSHVWFFATLWTLACQVPLYMGFSRQEYWNGLPCPPAGDLPDLGIEPTFMSPALAGEFFTHSTIGKLHIIKIYIYIYIYMHIYTPYVYFKKNSKIPIPSSGYKH